MLLRVPAIGVNGGVEHRGVRPDGDGPSHDELTTTWMPRFVLPRMRPTGIDGVPVRYDDLVDTALDISALQRLTDGMNGWIDRVEIGTSLFEPGEEGSEDDENRQRLRFANDVRAWRKERSRIAKGIDLLERAQDAWRRAPASSDAIPYRAWLLMNRTFAANGANPGWRLFQIAFILTHVPTLASRLPGYVDFFDAEFDEESASLLYMSTGGGKSEAFFGILIYALFLDRLRGKRRGITAMVHYPLRLLTLQQARRLMRLLARAEVVRFDERLGGAPFAIGFWVGGNNTPNNTMKGDALHEDMRDIPTIEQDPTGIREVELRRENRIYEGKNESWNKLQTCPFCDPSGTAGHLTGLRIFPELQNRLGIVCANDDCSWNLRQRRGSAREPLPFLLVDTDIYRHAPSVLLGTIDKLALLGNHPSTIDKVAGMFGMARFLEGDPDTGLLHQPYRRDKIAECESEQQRVAPAYEGGVEVFHDPFPSLIVQDELHLLEESLGTFGGIFETALFAWLAELAVLLGHRVPRMPGAGGRPRMPHVVGSHGHGCRCRTADDALVSTPHRAVSAPRPASLPLVLHGAAEVPDRQRREPRPRERRDGP